MVGASLLKAIKKVLGDAATNEIMDAWEKAYGALAEILVGAENGLRASNEDKENGWSGFKDMICSYTIAESEDVTSFYISNIDHSPVCTYTAGT